MTVKGRGEGVKVSGGVSVGYLPPLYKDAPEERVKGARVEAGNVGLPTG